MYYIWFYYLYISDIAPLPCIFIPFLAVIRMNVTSPDILCISCMNYFYFPSVLIIKCHIYFHQHLSRGDQHLYLNFPLLVWCWCSHAPWSFHLLIIMCLHLCILVRLGQLCQCGPSLLYSSSMSSLFFIWRHTWQWRLPGNLLLDLLRHSHSVHYAHLVSSHILPLQYILLLQFVLILPHII